MRLSDYKKDFYEFSGKASDSARAAALGGIAVIWIFHTTTTTTPLIPTALLLPTVLFASALGLDLIHYVVAALIWGIFYRIHERNLRKATDNPQLAHPTYLSGPIWALFILKIACVLAGYITLVRYLWPLWFQGS